MEMSSDNVELIELLKKEMKLRFGRPWQSRYEGNAPAICAFERSMEVTERMSGSQVSPYQ